MNKTFAFLLSPVILCTILSIASLRISAQSSSAAAVNIDSLIGIMTLEEKIGQMTQYNGFWDVTGPKPKNGEAKVKYEHIRSGRVGSMLNVTGAEQTRMLQELAVNESRLGIPMIFAFDVIHGFKTTFPIPLAEAASWNLDLIQRSAEVAAREAAASGLHWTFAPMVDISRDARWGRVMEGAGEDPYLGAEVAKARIRGFQGKDLSDPLTVAACAKHLAGYGFAEAGRDYNTAEVGTHTLQNVILPPFRASVDAEVATLMTAFNDINGIPATADRYLLREQLKQKWGFNGFVVSDWGSIGEMIAHGYSRDGSSAAESAALAGCDMDMESNLYIRHLEELVQKGDVPMELINDAVGRILLIKQKLGLFEDPYRYCAPERERTLVFTEAHRKVALDVALESIVLLKNEDNFLPLKKEGMKVAVIGDLADDKNSPLGNWRLASEDHSAVSVWEGLQPYKGNEYTFSRGVELQSGAERFVQELKINTTDSSLFEEAAQLARKSDVVIMVLGEHGYQSGEGRSRAFLDLPGLQQQLLERVYAENKKIVLVGMSGRPLVYTWAEKHLPALLQVWHLGTESGHAIAKVIFGDHNPSGKLPMTFPRSVGQAPIYYNQKSTGRPGPKEEVFWSHYIDESNAPLYPFGYGLSYTRFDYSDLEAEVLPSGEISASVSVENTGDRDGAEIVQLYIRDHFSSVIRPVKELKGFQKIHLPTGEKKKVTFKLTLENLGFYDAKGDFQIEEGAFDIMVGPNSEELLRQTLQWKIGNSSIGH